MFIYFSFLQCLTNNPRYLVSSGDTPAILQEGFRYNALHVACRTNQPNVCAKVILCDLKLLYFKIVESACVCFLTIFFAFYYLQRTIYFKEIINIFILSASDLWTLYIFVLVFFIYVYSSKSILLSICVIKLNNCNIIKKIYGIKF